MKKLNYLILVLLISSSVFASKSTMIEDHDKGRYSTSHYDGVFLSHLNVAAGVSTLGFTIEAATPLSERLKLRAGIDVFNFNTKQYDFDIDDTEGTLHEAFGFTPTYESKGSLNAVHGHALVDFYPFKGGILHLTAGAYIGSNKLKAKGILTDGNGTLVELKPGYEWPTIDFDGKELDINHGRLDAELTLGQTIKPYIGIGLGRAVSKKRLGVKFEIGVMYQGDYTLKQNGKTVATTTDINASIEDADKVTKWLKWWPMVNLQLNYRIF
ncbi:hypothetical protein LNQ81_06735 [Myroides sp. M-43]|uniref:hypothetical protein n=1 Tax=Myroides oncorhynchi TaxID=2893756 RepID=UPI001E3416FD|nr:hypothetical protein [Myroides oncorhynchi]MCC9042389.1 hypothetical protein [Myroides oncorhynchi]